jgi:hypothetical protein
MFKTIIGAVTLVALVTLIVYILSVPAPDHVVTYPNEWIGTISLYFVFLGVTFLSLDAVIGRK